MPYHILLQGCAQNSVSKWSGRVSIGEKKLESEDIEGGGGGGGGGTPK